MKTLFFDIQITGHHTEYISHLVDYLNVQNDLQNEYVFVVHPDFNSKFPIIFKKANKIANIHWVAIKKEEYDRCMDGSVIRKYFYTYYLMNRYSKLFKVDHVCLLYFNIFQLATIFYRSPYTLSGILFLQFYRMNKDSFKDKLKYYRKYAITKLYTLNPKIKKIFVLNDLKTVSYLNNTFKTNIFKMLPDPIPALNPLEGFDIYEQYDSKKNRKIFLHIGSLGNRKGTFEVIDSAKHISLEKQAEIFILLVGKAENSSTAEIISNKIKENLNNSKVKIVWDNQFVSNEKMKSLFDQSFSVVMPYKNTEGSSGILGHSAAANKKVISTGKGLLKEIIEEHQLGVLLENVTPNEIALAMEKLLLGHDETIKLNKFVLEHSPNKFSELIISN